MIKYKLICTNCDLKFDSWFASSNEYERLKKKKLLNCHNCNSYKVEKTIMAPQLINSKSKTDKKIDLEKYSKVKKTIKDYQKFIKDNFQYVGDNFAYEARSIHYNGKKKSISSTCSTISIFKITSNFFVTLSISGDEHK